LPLLIEDFVTEELVDSILGLKHRIRLIHLASSSKATNKRLYTAMQVPFPELENLHLSCGGPYGPVVPDLFLGGSAPRLRNLDLDGIPFPGLPKLLLSATHLVRLRLNDITKFWYISPEAMVTCISMLTGLEKLHLGFIQFFDDRLHTRLKSRRPSPPTSVLPALKNFWFDGSVEYMEEFVARIDAPRLYRFSVAVPVFRDIDFKAPELNQFINRTPTLGAYDEARFVFEGRKALVKLSQSHDSHRGPCDHHMHKMVEINILYGAPNLQLSSVQMCTSSFRLLSTVENLYIDGGLVPSIQLVLDFGIGNNKWWDLLLPYTAVKNLHLSKPLTPRIALALQELAGGRIKEVLPALQNILLEGFQPSESVQEGIAQFISERQLIDHRTIAISAWHHTYSEYYGWGPWV
jgi:hypothetical protein